MPPNEGRDVAVESRLASGLKSPKRTGIRDTVSPQRCIRCVAPQPLFEPYLSAYLEKPPGSIASPPPLVLEAQTRCPQTLLRGHRQSVRQTEGRLPRGADSLEGARTPPVGRATRPPLSRKRIRPLCLKLRRR